MKKEKSSIRRAELVIFLFVVLAVLISWMMDEPDAPTEGAGWTSPDDLAHATFSVVTGSAYDAVIRERYPDATLKHVSDWADETLQVSLGKADALFREKSSIPEIQDEYPELVPMEEPVSELVSHWCTRKTPAGLRLCREVDAFIDELREADMLTALYSKWENQKTAPDHVDEYPMTGEYQGKLRIVSCLDWPPVSYQNGKNACGYMIELAVRFCAWAGYEPVFEFVDIQSALAGFEAGKYDLFAYGNEYTEESAET